MKNKFNAVTIILIILLAIRAIMQIVLMAMQKDLTFIAVFIFFTIIYLAALIGVSLKHRFGSVITIIIAVVDLLFALASGGEFGLGAGVMDLALIYLGYKEYHQIKN